MKQANGNGAPARQDLYERFQGDEALEGFDIAELLHEPPTTLLTVHATFSIRHVLAEIAYHLDLDNLTRDDLAILSDLGIAANSKLEGENNNGNSNGQHHRTDAHAHRAGGANLPVRPRTAAKRHPGRARRTPSQRA